MESLIELAFWVVLITGIYILIRIFKQIFFKTQKKKFFPKPKRLFISAKVKAKADRKFYKLLNKFKREQKRKPTKDDLFRIIISASHITIRRRGANGHWGRQKVRKYLLEKNNVVKEYKMR